MLTQEGFDRWVPDYDKTVSRNEKENAYPFAGYQNVLTEIYHRIQSGGGSAVLDLGFGTASLTSRLYSDGYEIFGMDFSKDMLCLARKKMPKAVLAQGDFTEGLPQELDQRKYDFILGTYSFHHVPVNRRVSFFTGLADRLTEKGQIIIGDVAFRTAEKYETCHRKFADIWDEDEYYFTAQEFTRQMSDLRLTCAFQPVSFCAGVLTLCRESAK
ncbi:class I SAM-dependent methyltransferase [Caproicibacter fermentans]|uniref:Class I SAM-dependent methyltransferase n=1 Tax=Caproicibacter fermentans TaxID=2576756 RepID=A0A7G8TC19_9FIRM|nr:class I SAM-dependent methyltransferase [Caproicibacter fermentans]QNK41160.1 class I SAM-dependent methyltransferase [Caproicibacter fermentans]